MSNLNLPKEKFLWEKTGISEVAPRPSVFTFDLLKKIYANDGPVARVWQRHGIKYFNTEFLRLVDGDLYIDREKELQSFFPAFSLLKSESFKPKLVRVKGFLRTARNAFFFLFLSSKNPRPIREKLFVALNENFLEKQNLEICLKDFLSDYEIVFEINLLAEAALSSLQAAIGHDQLDVVEALNLESDEKQKEIDNYLPPADIVLGNSLEITDVSSFVTGQMLSTQTKTAVEIFKNVPTWKQSLLIQRIRLAQEGQRLRECGRWLMLRHLNRLRPLAQTETPKPALQVLPARLSHLVEIKIQKKSLGVSAGQASGVIVNKEMLLKTPRPCILYHSVISPDLVQYLSRVDGIISEQGSVLSHLAIVAREQGIPVIVGLNLSDADLSFGDEVEINGTTGEWKKK